MTGPASQFAFSESVGFTSPVDNPVELISHSGDELFESVLIDVRAFNSVAFTLDLSGGTYLPADVTEIEINFFVSPLGGAQNKIFSDRMYLFSESSAGFPVMFSDAVHGGWMSVNTLEYSGAGRSTNLALKVFGSYRSVPSFWVRNPPNSGTTNGGVIWDHTAGGGFPFTDNAAFGVGRALARLTNSGAGTATMTIAYTGGTVTGLKDLVTQVGAGTTYQEILLPRRQARITIANGAAGTVTSHIITEARPQ